MKRERALETVAPISDRQVCAKVLPTVMLCLIDPGSDAVREAAFACVDTYMSKLRQVSARMKVEEAERRRIEVGVAYFNCK